MSTTQRRTVVVLATAVAALAALLLGMSVGESLTEDREISTDQAVGTSETTEPADSGETADNTELIPTTAPPTTTPPTTTTTTAPEPPATGCDAPHRQGTWSVDGPGESVAINDMAPFGGDCVGVEVTLDGAVSDVEVQRHGVRNTTMVRFTGSGPEPGPIGNDFIDFGVTEDRIWRAVVVSDDQGMGVLLYHPGEISNALGAHVDIDSNTLRLSIRERTGDDPAPTGSAYEGEPYHRTPRGPFHDGLLVDLLVDAEGSGVIALQGYAKAPESHIEVEVFDTVDDSLVCEDAGMTQGAMWHFSRYEFTCDPAAPGTYDVVVGWPSLSDDPSDAVWRIEEVSVG